jgi:hypothetical protein
MSLINVKIYEGLGQGLHRPIPAELLNALEKAQVSCLSSVKQDIDGRILQISFLRSVTDIPLEGQQVMIGPFKMKVALVYHDWSGLPSKIIIQLQMV